MRLVPRHLSSSGSDVVSTSPTADAYYSSSSLGSMSDYTFYTDTPTSYPVYPTSTWDYVPSSSFSTPYSSSTSADRPELVETVSDSSLGTSATTSSSYSVVPPSTALAKPDSATSATNHTALVASLTAAGVAAILLLLFLAFLLLRRKRRRPSRHTRLSDSTSLPRSALLRDDDVDPNVQMSVNPFAAGQYESQNSIYRTPSPTPSILRSRVSESGSIFREEVWPPPSPVVDPIQMRSSQVDLSRIVDDVMGPQGPTEQWKVHKRDFTTNSTTPLLIERQSSLERDSSEDDYSHVHHPSYGFVSEFFPPTLQSSQHSSYDLRHAPSSISLSSSYSLPGQTGMPSSFRPPSAQGSIASSTYHRTQPKVSSPLVRTLPGFGGV